MHHKNHMSLRSWALMSVATAAIASPAWAQEARNFNIPQQDLAAALEAFGQQSDKEILFSMGEARGRAARAVQGEYDPQEALRLLLSDSGMAFRRANANTFVVEAPSPQGAGAAGGGADVDALIVTAQKKEENIQDVPIAISAFSQKALEEQKIEGGFDLLKAIPNVTFSKNNFTSYNFSIRGIGTKAVSPTTDPGVAVEFNDTPMIRNRLFEQEYFDVDRVEVLRGPQGTLHGRNATSGVINVISAKPRLTELQGQIKLEGGNYNAQRVVGMVNVPIIEDMLGIRVSGAMTTRDGYGLNLYDNSAADGRDLWSIRTTIGFEPNERFRADLIWERFREDDDRQRTSKQLCTRDPGPEFIDGYKIAAPTGLGSDQTTIEQVRSIFSQGCLPGSLYGDAAYETPNGFAIPFISALASLNIGVIGASTITGTPVNAIMLGIDPYGNTTQSRDLRAFYSQIPSVYQASADLLELNMRFDLTDDLTITSQTAYNSDNIYASQDFNRYTTVKAFNDSNFLDPIPLPSYGYDDLLPGGIFCDPQLGCSDTIIGMDISRADSEQFSQEIRLQSNYDGPLNFSLGANYLRYETLEDYYVFFNAATLAMIVSLNGNIPGSRSADRVTTNPDCTVATAVSPLGPGLGFPGYVCVPIENNSIENLQDYGHNYFLSRNPYRLKSKGLFGELYWNITDSLKLTTGLRYSDDQKIFTPIPSQTGLTPRDNPGLLTAPQLVYEFYLGSPLTGTGFGYPARPDIKLQWKEVTGRIGLDWKPVLPFTDETMVYGFFSRGYKGGGMNPPPVGLNYDDALNAGIIYAPQVAPIFQPEFVNAYELGTKNTLFGGGVVLNGSAFYYDYKGYQVSKIVDRSAQNENFDAKIWGLELESILVPSQNLRFNVALGYLNTRIADGSASIDLMDRVAGHDDWVLVKPAMTLTSNCIVPAYVAAMIVEAHPFPDWLAGACPGGSILGVNFSGIAGPFGASFLPDGSTYDPSAHPESNYGTGFLTDISGNDLPNAPHYTVTLGSQYRRPVFTDWTMTLRADFYWQSQSFARVYNSQYDKLRAWTNFNLSLWFEQRDLGLQAEVYVKNVLNEAPITDAFLNSDDTALTTNIFTLDPRLIGVSIRKTF